MRFYKYTDDLKKPGEYYDDNDGVPTGAPLKSKLVATCKACNTQLKLHINEGKEIWGRCPECQVFLKVE